MIRKAKTSDIDSLMTIFCAAKADLRSRGVRQWQDGYPDRTVIERDIENGEGYVAVCEGEKIMAYAAISFDGEPTYQVIEDGSWITGEDEGYAVIHRVVSAPGAKRQGAASELLDYAKTLCRARGAGSIRIDTHHDNTFMRQWLLKNEFTYCGRITLSDGAPRSAFEKTVQKGSSDR